MSQRGASIRGPPGGCQPIVKPAPCNVRQARRLQAGSPFASRRQVAKTGQRYFCEHQVMIASFPS